MQHPPSIPSSSSDSSDAARNTSCPSPLLGPDWSPWPMVERLSSTTPPLPMLDDILKSVRETSEIKYFPHLLQLLKIQSMNSVARCSVALLALSQNWSRPGTRLASTRSHAQISGRLLPRPRRTRRLLSRVCPLCSELTLLFSRTRITV